MRLGWVRWRWFDNGYFHGKSTFKQEREKIRYFREKRKQFWQSLKKKKTRKIINPIRILFGGGEFNSLVLH